MYSKLVQLIEWYDARKARQTSEPCTSDILCPRTGKRHHDGCLGRTEPFTTYAKALRSL